MPRRSSRTRRSRSTRKTKRRSRRRTQRGGTLAFLKPQETQLAVGLPENPEGEYDNPDNMPIIRAIPR